MHRTAAATPSVIASRGKTAVLVPSQLRRACGLLLVCAALTACGGASNSGVDAGTGRAGADAGGSSPQRAPDAPTGVLVEPGDTDATVRWSPPQSSPDAPVAGYVVKVEPGGRTLEVGSAARSVQVRDLAHCVEHTFSVVARNSVGTSAMATAAALVGRVPAAPTDVTAAEGDGEALVSWSAPACTGASSITGYTVLTRVNDTVVGTRDVTDTSVRLTDLSNGAPHRFLVSARNAGGSSTAATSAVVIPFTVPGAVGELSSMPSRGQVALHWQAPAFDGGRPVLGYAVTVTGNGERRTLETATPELLVTGLSERAGYRFEVLARNERGSGATSTALGLPRAPRVLAGGEAHSIAVRADGTVAAWGAYADGQAAVPAGLSGVVSVAAGDTHNVALRADGTVVSWGRGAGAPASLRRVMSIGAGPLHGVAVLSDGTVQWWGADGAGLTPVPAGLTGVVAVASHGSGNGVALRWDGTVVTWGSTGGIPAPPLLSGVVAVAAGSHHALALKADGSVVGWGADGWGQATVPDGLADVVDVAATSGGSLALKADGTVVAWGLINGSQVLRGPTDITGAVALGAGVRHFLAAAQDGTVEQRSDYDYGQARAPAGLSGVTRIAAGYQHSLALLKDGTVRGWGSQATGVPEGLSGVKAIAASQHSLAVRADGTLVSWRNDWSNPVLQVPSGLSGVVEVSHRESALALKEDGTVVAWSSGWIQQPVEGLAGVVSVSVGASHFLALKQDGTLVAWGDNSQQQTTVPDAPGGFRAVSAGAAHSLALLQDGSVVAWGYNDQGQTQVPASLSNVVAVSAGHYHCLALRQDGTVVAWGGLRGRAWVPEGLTSVVAISAGFEHSLALKADGTVVGWLNDAPPQGLRVRVP